VHNFGADAVTELACMLSTLAEIARQPDGKRIRSNPNGISIRLGVNSAHLGCIAKLRAARILWNAKAKHPHDSNLQIHAETSRTELSHTDTWTNIIRHSAAAAAAIMGNCDGLLIHPHDARIARTNPFGNRIARNIFNTLIFESKLNAFADPLAGSFAIEAMTSELVDKSWQLHEQIENSGGLLSNLDLANTKAILPHLIQTQRAALIAEESHRRPGLLGVSEYPNLAEVADLENHENPGTFITYSAKPQLAENWNEELRLSDIFGTLKNAGITANIEYVPILIDEPSAIAARLAWTENALSAAGIGVSQSKTPPPNAIHVIIGKDSTYKEKLLATLGELHSQGSCFVVAGRLPSELETAAIACGLTATLYAGCNLEKTLRQVLLQVGAKL
jgi:methylmalonyl-CoA mutase